MSDYEPVSSFAKNIKCICPKCGKKHYRLIYWTGNGIPRKLCPGCYNNMKNENTSELNESHIGNDISKRIKENKIL